MKTFKIIIGIVVVGLAFFSCEEVTTVTDEVVGTSYCATCINGTAELALTLERVQAGEADQVLIETEYSGLGSARLLGAFELTLSHRMVNKANQDNLITEGRFEFKLDDESVIAGYYDHFNSMKQEGVILSIEFGEGKFEGAQGEITLLVSNENENGDLDVILGGNIYMADPAKAKDFHKVKE